MAKDFVKELLTRGFSSFENLLRGTISGPEFERPDGPCHQYTTITRALAKNVENDCKVTVVEGERFTTIVLSW